MTDKTQQLIADLVTQLAPVRPLRTPFSRAVGWLLSVAIVGALYVLYSARAPHRGTYSPMDVEFWSMLATAVLGILAAFNLSVPESSRRWIWAPIAPLALWIVSSGTSCYQLWRAGAPASTLPAESPGCFRFIVIVSVPLAAFLLWMLRRARPLAPVPVALTAGIGVAAAAAFLLQFFHPFDVTFMDLALHLAAVSVIVGALAASGRKILG
jgi:hypothetical protein